MNYTVQIKPTNQTFSVEDNESVLDAALRQGVVLPYGCRNGSCGSCKGRLLEGELAYPDRVPEGLTQKEAEQGWVLLCQGRPRSALRVEVDALESVREIRVRTFPARVERRVQLAHDVMALHLKLPEKQRLQFLAGQYVDVILRDGRRRAFSMANAPHDDALLELHVRNVPGGEFSAYVFDRMKEGSLLRCQGPLGSFFLREQVERPLIFAAGGTGFAPIKGIVEHALHKGIKRPMHLYWGVRARRDLYLHDLAQTWVRQHDFIHYVPVLSDPRPSDQWPGRTGLVHEALLADFPDPSPYDVYASGPPVMVYAIRDALLARDLDPAHLFSDAFEYAFEDGHDR